MDRMMRQKFHRSRDEVAGLLTQGGRQARAISRVMLPLDGHERAEQAVAPAVALA